MLKGFNNYLDKLDSEFWGRLIHEHGKSRSYAKGEEIITIGTVGQYMGLIKSGSVKYVAYTSDGDEKIVGLETIGGFTVSWPYCLHGLPSLVSIIANSDTVIYAMSVPAIRELANSNIELDRQISQSIEQIFYTAYGRLVDFYIRTPKERYKELMKKCPKIFEIFSLKDISSYLNITPTHLSRLRKEVKES